MPNVKNELKMYIDGKYYGVVTQKEALLKCLLPMKDHIMFMNVENIKNWFEEAFATIESTFDFKKNLGMARRFANGREFLKNDLSHSVLIRYFYDMILSLSGNGTLQNFGIAGTNLNGEKFSLNQVKK